jgi:hypothetical protein
LDAPASPTKILGGGGGKKLLAVRHPEGDCCSCLLRFAPRRLQLSALHPTVQVPPTPTGGGTGLYWTRVSCIYESFPIFKPFLVQILKEIFYLTVAPPFPGSHLNMFLVKKENPPFFIPDPALPGRTYRPRASPVRVLLRRRVSDRYVLPQLASCGEMAIA